MAASHITDEKSDGALPWRENIKISAKVSLLSSSKCYKAILVLRRVSSDWNISALIYEHWV
jgi:hypothetical protein